MPSLFSHPEAHETHASYTSPDAPSHTDLFQEPDLTPPSCVEDEWSS